MGKTAIVTGASSGIGAHVARLLAGRGYDLVVVARRVDRLEALKGELEAAHRVSVTPLGLDLSDPAAPERLYAATEGAGVEVEVLVNNAGFGTQGAFVVLPWEKMAEQMRLNVWALTELCRRFLPAMKQRDRGFVLNVSSTQAFLPVAGYATYAAGKSFVRAFSEAVAHELRGTHVKVCCLCPGPVDTEFLAVAGQKVTGPEKLAFMTAERCARIGVRAMFAGRRVVVSGVFMSALMWLTRFVPRRVLATVTAFFMERRR